MKKNCASMSGITHKHRKPDVKPVLSHRADGIETDKNGKPIPLSKKFKRREHKTNRK